MNDPFVQDFDDVERASDLTSQFQHAKSDDQFQNLHRKKCTFGRIMFKLIGMVLIFIFFCNIFPRKAAEEG